MGPKSRYPRTTRGPVVRTNPPNRSPDVRQITGTADLKTVQEQLGHTSIVLTADTYTSVLLDLHFKAAEATARLVLKRDGPLSHDPHLVTVAT